jgi:S-sulfo-L-cysteine synthase (O-acetyl-L-serine-dependent)
VIYAANVFDSVLEMIGNTPIIKLNKINKNVNIYAKFEGNNPGGSIKDRIALKMIESAEKEGKLKKNQILLEATSGNTGIGLAMIAAIKGYKIILTMSKAVSEERKKILRAYGAKIIETNPDEGTDGAIRKAKELFNKNKKKYFLVDQYNNINNPLAHYHGTANEIIEQIPNITHFISTLGTSGTLIGVSKRLKEYNSKIKIIAVEPVKGHKIQGLKNMDEAIVPGIYNVNAYDKKIMINDENAFSTARLIAKNEGLLVGMSSGAAMYVALNEAKKINKGNIVVIFPDRGEKYLSTVLYSK